MIIVCWDKQTLAIVLNLEKRAKLYKSLQEKIKCI